MPKQKTRKTIQKRIKITSSGKLLRRHQLAVGHLKRKKSKGALKRAKKSTGVFNAESKKYKNLLGSSWK